MLASGCINKIRIYTRFGQMCHIDLRETMTLTSKERSDSEVHVDVRGGVFGIEIKGDAWAPVRENHENKLNRDVSNIIEVPCLMGHDSNNSFPSFCNPGFQPIG